VSNDSDDITPLLAAKSDQLNADDLIAGPITVRVVSARITGGMEQPVTVELDGGHRPWKPCKTTMRVLAALWGSAPSAWAGRLVRLYRDPTVKYGGVEVGGIRISGMSHIDGPKKITLAASKKSKVEHRIDVLKAEQPKQTPRAVQQDDAPAPGADDFRASVRLYLREIGADMRLRGHPPVASSLAELENPSCVLTRTNATAVDTVLARQRRGQRVHLVGGGSEVVAFAKAAQQLMAGDTTWHPELACFTSWGEVQEYVEQDPQGSELALLVRLVDEYGVDTIMRALNVMVPEEVADVVVSTGHKAKGREWPTVQLADDFPDPRDSFAAMLEPDWSVAELRLIYVAVTRAREVLDVTRCGVFEQTVPVKVQD